MKLKEFILNHREKVDGSFAVIPDETLAADVVAFIGRGKQSSRASGVPWHTITDLVEMIAETMEFMYRKYNIEIVGIACNPDNEARLAEALQWFANPEPMTNVKEEDPGWTDDD